MKFSTLLISGLVTMTSVLAVAPTAQANALTNPDGSCKTGYAYSHSWSRCVHPVDLTHSDRMGGRPRPRGFEQAIGGSSPVAEWLRNNTYCPTVTTCYSR